VKDYRLMSRFMLLRAKMGKAGLVVKSTALPDVGGGAHLNTATV
jgi:hypothetical protein